jgi:hypothetical protein
MDERIVSVQYEDLQMNDEFFASGRIRYRVTPEGTLCVSIEGIQPVYRKFGPKDRVYKIIKED